MLLTVRISCKHGRLSVFTSVASISTPPRSDNFIPDTAGCRASVKIYMRGTNGTLFPEQGKFYFLFYILLQAGGVVF